MPILIDDLKNNKLYRKKMYIPSDPKNKRKHSVIFLMTPDYMSSVKAMSNPMFINNRRYESYYTEKNITFVLSENNKLIQNDDEITAAEPILPQCSKMVFCTLDSLDHYGIEYDEDLKDTDFICYAFIYNSQCYGYIILCKYNTCIYKIDAYSYQMKSDLIQSTMIFFQPKSVKIWDELDKKWYMEYGFKKSNVLTDNTPVLVKESAVPLLESINLSKIDIEIELWKAQIKITELIIKNFNNDNWMTHMYDSIKRKLNKIPLDGYIESTDNTIERWKNKLSDQKATLDFYLSIKTIESKEIFDISDVTTEYIDWVQSLSCPKSLKLKIINETISSYNNTIKECEYNLKRYRTLDDTAKRIENVKALVKKVYSLFGFISATPTSIIKGTIVKSILPKSQKKNVLSEAELEAKIELYTKIVETLQQQKNKIESLQESTILESTKDVYYFISTSSNEDNTLYYTDGGIGIYDNIMTAIQRYPHKKYKLYVYSADLKFISKDADCKIKFDGGAKLDLLGEISVTYSISKNVRSYEWTTLYGDNGTNILEAKLSTDELKAMDISDFGLPEDRKYPMPDKAHVLSAIKMFNNVDKDKEAKLAQNILKKIKKFNMQSSVNVGENNKFFHYWNTNNNESNVIEGYIVPRINNEASLTPLGLQTENSITFLEGNDEVLVEGDASYNVFLRRILYSERIKTQKEIMLLYKQVKEDCPFIKYTFINYARYNERNLFIDWSYYTSLFFKNNMRKYDKAVDLFFEFVNRFLRDNRLEAHGYTQKTVIIPVDDWIPEAHRENWNYKINLNPISIIYRLTYRDLEKLKAEWSAYNFIFTGKKGYFKIDFSTFDKKELPRFIQNIKRIINNENIIDDAEEPDDSVGGIVNTIIDNIETKNIKINNLTGASKASIEEIKNKPEEAAVASEKNSDTNNTEDKLVQAITKKVVKSSTPEEALDKIQNDDYIKDLITDLRNTAPDAIPVNPTRASRIRKNNDAFLNKKIKDQTVKDLLSPKAEELEETALPIDSINDEWKHLTYINHAKKYDLHADIVKCLYHFGDRTVPVSILDYTIEDTSTSEDWVYTITVKCEDINGKRFTLKFDIPKLKNNRFMHLRGNDKTINNQLMNLPIIKTEENTCQMTSNYNKIFFSGYGTSTGKSFTVADRIIKTLNKMDKNPNMEIKFGDNSRICSKYELPIDYIDIASMISNITYKDHKENLIFKFYFNQDELHKEYEKSKFMKDKNSLVLGTVTNISTGEVNSITYSGDLTCSNMIYNILAIDPEFENTYKTTNPSVRYTYSKASILNTHIPVAVIIGYYIGLINMLDRLKINYSVTHERPRYDKNKQDIIVLSDAYIVYDLTYETSMLFNGLKECDIAAYSIKEVNTKKMWIELLDNFGGRLKADGLDMFYDLMIDPITAIVCKEYQLPIDFVDGLFYANMLLADNKYNTHSNITGRRYRSTEIIAGYVYKSLCNSYTQYRRDLRSGRDARMTIKQTAVLDLLFADNTFSDLSILSDLLEAETASTTSSKGLSGMNSDRAYGLDKRTFDKSMVNVLALSTGFAGNAGINRQSTIDMNINSTRGYITNSSPDKMSVTKSFCMTEALTPFGTTSDDSFRSAMTFIQTSKHSMRVKTSDPLLVTNGADQALPYMTSNTFTYKPEKPGKIIEKTDDYMVLQYKDTGNTEVVDLREKIYKNSDGGMHIAVKLESDLKVGDVFSTTDIIAADKSSYSSNVGPNTNLSYNIGTFVKFAIINSDEGFEDSCVTTDWLSSAMSSTVIINKEYTLPKDTNVYFIASKGQKIQEGEPLLIFQNSFDEEDANMLIKTLSDENGDQILSELGKIPIYSKVTGVIKDIKINRTVDIEELSPSLNKIVTSYERDVNKFNKVLNKYDKDKAKTADATYKLEPTGKLKNAKDSVRIEFSLAYQDDFGVGDKTVCYSALKGVVKGKIPTGKEAYSAFRPEEKIHYIQCTNGDMKRMVGSILKVGGLNKVMVELARASCDIMGIKWKYFDEY